MVISQPAAGDVSPVFDVRVYPHDDVLERVERVLDVGLDRSSVIYGEYGATEGFRSSSGTWVRIERRQRWRINSAVWIGLEAAATIRGVRKPEWYQSTSWIDAERDVVWRADEVELVTSPAVESTEAAHALPESWWVDLRQSLSALAEHKTERVGMSQAHLTKRIREVFPDADTTVDEWATAHTDLHWKNVTTDGYVLDWEDWGAAPRGHDAACLWQASLTDSALAARVQQEFADDLQTRSGRLTQLLQCANAIRIARRRGVSTPLSEAAKAAADILLTDLA